MYHKKAVHAAEKNPDTPTGEVYSFLSVEIKKHPEFSDRMHISDPELIRLGEEAVVKYLPLLNKSGNSYWYSTINRCFPGLLTPPDQDGKVYLAKNIEGCGDKEIINNIIRRGVKIP